MALRWLVDNKSNPVVSATPLRATQSHSDESNPPHGTLRLKDGPFFSYLKYTWFD